MGSQMAAIMPQTAPAGFCLLTPAQLTGDILTGAVTTALSHPSTEVIILTPATQENASPELVADLRTAATRHGKVFLVENDIDLALELDAEGMLLADIEDIGRTKNAIGEKSMVGIACGLSRHKAMEAGEAGADFVGLGERDPTGDNTLKTAEHIAWWSSIFEIPSVALGIKNRPDAEAFATAGADFLALGDPFWNQDNMVRFLETLKAGADK